MACVRGLAACGDVRAGWALRGVLACAISSASGSALHWLPDYGWRPVGAQGDRLMPLPILLPSNAGWPATTCNPSRSDWRKPSRPCLLRARSRTRPARKPAAAFFAALIAHDHDTLELLTQAVAEAAPAKQHLIAEAIALSGLPEWRRRLTELKRLAPTRALHIDTLLAEPEAQPTLSLPFDRAGVVLAMVVAHFTATGSEEAAKAGGCRLRACRSRHRCRRRQHSPSGQTRLDPARRLGSPAACMVSSRGGGTTRGAGRAAG